MAEGTSGMVNTLVFMDLETTGLKSQGKNPEITELFMLAVGRKEFMSSFENKVENSLKLAFNTQKAISKKASEITGLNANRLSDHEILNANTFKMIDLFLSRLKKPVCLLAHNGIRFDFALLRDELKRIGEELMADLLCADTLQGFKDIDKKDVTKSFKSLSLSDSPGDSTTKPKISYKLEEIYKRKFSKKIDSHRAECDVKMMYHLALVDKKEFLCWVDEKAIKFCT